MALRGHERSVQTVVCLTNSFPEGRRLGGFLIVSKRTRTHLLLAMTDRKEFSKPMLRTAILSAIVVALLSSCSGSGPTAPVPVASIAITSTASTVKAGKTILLVAQAKDVAGNILTGRPFTWVSSNSGIATVSDGNVAAISAGSVVLTASSEGKSSDFPLVVARASLASIAVSATPSQLTIGQTVQTVTTLTDSTSKPVIDAVLSWSSTDETVATVNANGVISGINAGTARIDARAEGILGSATVTVIQVPVGSVTVTLSPPTMLVGQTGQATAAIKDAQGNSLSGRTATWASSDPNVASITGAGAITSKASGVVQITASSEGKSGSAQLTVTAPQPSCSAPLLTLGVGEIRTLAPSEKSAFCLTAGTSSEYVMIPFNNSPVAASTVSLRVSGTNTSAPSAVVGHNQLSALLSRSMFTTAPQAQSGELEFREREYRELTPILTALRTSNLRASRQILPAFITGVPATPAVGAVFPMNASLSGSLCSAKQLHGARVITVLPHVIVMSDTQSPTGGYTDAEMTAFGSSFEGVGYPLDTLNFGRPTDVDQNGRIVIFFTPGVNLIPGAPGAFVAGLFGQRDLFSAASCAGSNEGEMFYMPVPDPNKVINGSYADKSFLATTVVATLAHEFQHLINASRRIYVNNASAFEEVWLNEGLSHIAEELLYYQSTGNSPRRNIGLSTVQSSQSQLDAFIAYQLGNVGNVGRYMLAPENNSPYAQNDNLETRGPTWELLRYAADRKGGTERNTWFNLVNSTTAGQANFNGVFGDIVSMTRDWAVAQFADDIGFQVAAIYTNPSWNFRTLLPPINNGNFPLTTRTLLGSPIDLTLIGGAPSYVRFQITGGATAGVTANSSGQPLPSGVDVILMRTK